MLWLQCDADKQLITGGRNVEFGGAEFQIITLNLMLMQIYLNKKLLLVLVVVNNLATTHQ